MRIFATAVALSLIAATGAQAQPKVLRYAPAADLTLLDPMVVTALVTAEYGMMVYDTLFAFDATMNMKPQMVHNHAVSPDGLSYSFKLRPGLKFHNGQPVTSGDVIPSIRRFMKRDPLARRMEAALASFEPDGADGFKMVFKQPFPFVEAVLGWSGSGMAAIYPKADAEADAMKPISASIGSGPSKFIASEWKVGATAAWEKNADYVPRPESPDGLSGGKIPKLDRIELKYMPDASTRGNALKVGEIDLISLVPVDLTRIFKGDPNIVVERIAQIGGEGAIRMNQLQPPFNNLKARQALAHTIDQAEFMAAAYGDPEWWEQKGCFSWFVCGSANGIEAGSEPYRKPDLAKATQLLKESGYDGRPLVILTVTDVPSQYGMAQVMAGNLRKIGANVDLQAVDFGQLFARRENRKTPAEGGWNLIVLGYSAMQLASPLNNPVIDSSCERAPFGWPCDETIEKLKTAYLNESDPLKRKAVVEDISKAAWNSLPSILTGMYYNALARRSNVTGVVRAPHLVFWNAEKR
ncbi:MAG: ABC transporter substrate-binding protein [Alphaproteobacteria bacterium]|nr:ABC transporter substrate-binding protein [Alphaproteobacteria bacterium]